MDAVRDCCKQEHSGKRLGSSALQVNLAGSSSSRADAQTAPAGKACTTSSSPGSKPALHLSWTRTHSGNSAGRARAGLLGPGQSEVSSSSRSGNSTGQQLAGSPGKGLVGFSASSSGRSCQRAGLPPSRHLAAGQKQGGSSSPGQSQDRVPTRSPGKAGMQTCPALQAYSSRARPCMASAPLQRRSPPAGVPCTRCMFRKVALWAASCHHAVKPCS